MMTLENAQVDDYLVAGASYEERLHQVSRLTDTQVICGNTKFNKKTGYRVGDSGSWGRMYARLATEEDIKRITTKARCRDLNTWINRLLVTPENLPIVEIFYASIKSAAPTVLAQEVKKC